MITPSSFLRYVEPYVGCQTKTGKPAHHYGSARNSKCHATTSGRTRSMSNANAKRDWSATHIQGAHRGGAGCCVPANPHCDRDASRQQHLPNRRSSQGSAMQQVTAYGTGQATRDTVIRPVRPDAATIRRRGVASRDGASAWGSRWGRAVAHQNSPGVLPPAFKAWRINATIQKWVADTSNGRALGMSIAWT